MKEPHVTASNHSAKFCFVLVLVFLKYFETFLKRIMDGSEVWLRSRALFIFIARVHTQLENI